MSDRELNLAIHQEVEGWVGHVNPNRDYCNDPAWCVRMMERHKIGVSYWQDHMSKVWEWWAECGEVESTDYMEVSDLSLTRAVALVVLQLHRKEKANE